MLPPCQDSGEVLVSVERLIVKGSLEVEEAVGSFAKEAGLEEAELEIDH